MYKKYILTAACGTAAMLMLAAFSPARALFTSASEATAADFSKSAPAGAVLTFSEDDFACGGDLSGIIVSSLPDAAAGSLTHGGEELTPGSVVSAANLGALAFVPAADRPEVCTSFDYIPVFAGSGAAKDAVTVSLRLSDVPNHAPIARNLACETYCDLRLAGTFSAVDPEGDALTYELVGAPAHGTVTLQEGGFVYTPTGSRAETDAFTFAAVDAVGNRSKPAAVTIELQTRREGIAYADMENDPAHFAAVRLAELGILQGERIGASCFLYPDAPVTRAQFVAMAAKLTDLPLPTAAVSTGMADHEDVPVWARATVAAALDAGLLQGEKQVSGNAVVRASDPITRAETAVILDRLLQLHDDGRSIDYADAASVPAWAAQAVVNTVEAGYLPLRADGSFDPNGVLTRSQAAACLYRAACGR